LLTEELKLATTILTDVLKHINPEWKAPGEETSDEPLLDMIHHLLMLRLLLSGNLGQ
jgi:hypothetical protein